MSSIPLWKYHRASDQWLERQFSSEEQKMPRSVFRVLTYNIWFSKEHQPRRFQGLCRILEESHADVIGLQEVTNDVLRGLTNVPFIRDRYSLSDLDGRTFNSWYGVILLVANDLPVCRLSLVDFPHSQMGRRLILVDLPFSSGRLLRIGTVHLESLNNAEQRSEQLKICEKEFSRLSGDFILMGDFNFSDRSKENDDQFRLLSGWKDLWNSLKSDKDDNRFTFDTETNRMTKLSNGAIDRSRYDRIILKGERITPKEIDILGRDPIGNHKDLQIFASDHYGLTALVEKIEFL